MQQKLSTFTSSISTSATCKQEQRSVISQSKASKIMSPPRWESSITEQIYAAELAVYLTEELHSTLILVSPCNSICIINCTGCKMLLWGTMSQHRTAQESVIATALPNFSGVVQMISALSR